MRHCSERVQIGSRGRYAFAVVSSFAPLGRVLVSSFNPRLTPWACILPAASRLNPCYLKSRTSHYGQNAVYISVLKILYHRDRRVAELSWIADSVASAMLR